MEQTRKKEIGCQNPHKQLNWNRKIVPLKNQNYRKNPETSNPLSSLIWLRFSWKDICKIRKNFEEHRNEQFLQQFTKASFYYDDQRQMSS